MYLLLVRQADVRLRRTAGIAAAAADAINRPGLFHALKPKVCKADQSTSTNTLMDLLLLNATACWLEKKRSGVCLLTFAQTYVCAIHC